MPVPLAVLNFDWLPQASLSLNKYARCCSTSDSNNFFINVVSSIASIMKCFTVLALDEATLIEKITQDACPAASR
jgi:hypothetical protein